MGKCIAAVIAIALLLMAMCTSCKDTAQIESAADSESYTAEEVSFAAQGVLLDIVPQEDGYLLLADDSDQSKIMTLDKELSVISEEFLQLYGVEAIAENDGSIYSVARGETGMIVPTEIRQDDRQLYTFPDGILPHQTSLLYHDGSLYAFAHNSNSVSCLLCDGRNIPIEPSNEENVQREYIGIAEMEGSLFAFVRELKQKEEGWQDIRFYIEEVVANTEKVIPGEASLNYYVEPLMAACGRDNVYFLAGDSIYAYRNGAVEEICDLTYLGVSKDGLCRLLCGHDGKILLLFKDHITILRKKTAEELAATPDPEKVTVGIIAEYDGMPTSIDGAVEEFNRKNDRYKVCFHEYRSITQMNLGLLSGEIDIIYDGSCETFLNFIETGALASLEEWIPALFEEGVLMPNVLEAYRTDGVCYYLPRSVDVMGLSIGKSLMGERTDFESVDELLDFLVSLDDRVIRSAYRPDLLRTVICASLDGWIDWNTREAHFEDGSFAKMLEICNRASSDIGQAQKYWESFPSGLQPFMITGSGTVFEEDGDAVKNREEYVAFPIPAGDHKGMVLYGTEHFAIAANSGNKEGASAFLSYVLYEKAWPAAVTVDDPLSVSNGYWYVPIKQEDAKKYFLLDEKGSKEAKHKGLWEFYQKADHLYLYGPTLSIVEEEAMRYFYGEITAEKAAEFIQNRVQIYLDEQG